MIDYSRVKCQRPEAHESCRSDIMRCFYSFIYKLSDCISEFWAELHVFLSIISEERTINSKNVLITPAGLPGVDLLSSSFKAFFGKYFVQKEVF